MVILYAVESQTRIIASSSRVNIRGVSFKKLVINREPQTVTAFPCNIERSEQQGFRFQGRAASIRVWPSYLYLLPQMSGMGA